MRPPCHTPTTTLAFAALVVALMQLPASAEEPQQRGEQPVRWEQEVRTTTAIRIEQDLSLRLRPELVVGGDLSSGASPVPVPLTAEGEDPGSALAWAAIRVRYQPTVHLGQTLRIGLGLDLFDDMILGSSPGSSGGDGLWRESAGSPTAGMGGWRDAVRVRTLYGAWRVFEALELEAGRLTDQFGLGIVRNDGSCEDCDFGTVVDGIRASLAYAGYRLTASWEYTALGTIAGRAGDEGPAWDLGQDDDVTTYMVRVGRGPATDTERADRDRKLATDGGDAFEWSVFSSFTTQDLSSSAQPPPPGSEALCDGAEPGPTGSYDMPADCYQLVPRDAFFWRPGAWGRIELYPSAGTKLRAELEVAALIGNIGRTQGNAEIENSDKDFAGFAAAAELQYTMPSLDLGLNGGFATGDDRDYLGYLDGQNVVAVPEPSTVESYEENANISGNRTVTSFWFNRDYRLDLILFRQIIGGVTNAIYFKPWVSAEVFANDELGLDARLDVLYALAPRVSGTPGKGRHYGVEVDGRLELDLRNGLVGSLAAGWLLPLDALADPVTGAEPTSAFALRGLVTWSF